MESNFELVENGLGDWNVRKKVRIGWYTTKVKYRFLYCPYYYKRDEPPILATLSWDADGLSNIPTAFKNKEHARLALESFLQVREDRTSRDMKKRTIKAVIPVDIQIQEK